MGIDRKTLENIVNTYKKHTDRAFVPVSRLSRKQVVNAEEEFALDVADEEVIALLDTTMFSNGKKGFLLSEKKLYSSDFPLDPVELATIKKAEVSRENLKIHFFDGTSKTIHVKKYASEVASLLIAVCKENLLSSMNVLEKELDALGGDIQKAQKVVEKPVEETADEMNNRAHVLYRQGKIKEAFDLFLKSAEKGCNYAKYTCGEMYYNGEGTERNLEKAAFWFKKAAEKGHVTAMYDYAMMHFNGEVTGNSEDDPWYWIETAAEKGHTKAETYVNNVLQKDAVLVDYILQRIPDQTPGELIRNTDPELSSSLRYSLEETVKKLANAVDKGYYISEQYYEKNIKELFSAMRLIADSLSDDCMKIYYLAGMDLLKYSTSERAARKAFQYLSESAKHHYIPAKCQCAMMHLTGKGAPVDYEKAFHLVYKDAEIKQQAESQYVLGIIYENGYGVEKMPRHAFNYFKQAAAEGLPEAQYKCACAYAYGIGVKQDYGTAIEYALMAVAGGVEDTEHFIM